MLNKQLYRLDASYVKRAFQLSVELNVENSIFGAVKYNASIIYKWAKNKFVGLQMPQNIHDFSQNRSGQEVSILYKPEEHYFCIKASHPDNKVPGRFWTTEAEIIEHNNKVLFGVRLTYSTPVSQEVETIDYSVPVFVKKICTKNGLNDIRRINDGVWYIDKDNVMELYEFIGNKERKLPVIVVTESRNVEGIGGQYLNGFLIDGERFAKKVGLIAHVVYLSNEAADMWNDIVGKHWGVFNGAVRTYYPDVNFLEEAYLQHPLALANRILAAHYEDERGKEYIAGEAFEYILMNILRKYNTNLRPAWEKLGHKFYFLAKREELLNKEKAVEDAVLLNEMYEEQIQQLEEKINNQDDEYITAMIAMDNQKKELDENRQTIYRLNMRVDSLRKQLQSMRKGEINDIPILDDYSQLPEWVETYFPGRIVLHSRAIRSLKGATFNDAKLVFKAIKLLGTTYYQMRMGYVTLQEFTKQCNELGIEEAASIADTAAGELGETYFVSYRGEKCKLERHLRKGKVRDPQFCMRIYFFWSEEDSQIVIGSLPQHLATSTS